MKERYHAIDALRVFAMLSVVFLHSSISYMPTKLPDLLWAARDSAAHPFFDWLFLWIRGLTMRIFFLVAGFFAVKLYQDLGPIEFLQNRRRRILIPFLVGSLIILPITYCIWSYGWLLSGQCDLSQVLRAEFNDDIQKNLYGPAHLWFLEYLLIFYFIYFLVRSFVPASKNEGVSFGGVWIERILFSPLRPFFLAIPSILILWFKIDVVINFRNTFMPDPFKLLYYGVFFFVGVWLYRFREKLKRFTSFGFFYLLLSVPVFICMGLLLKKHFVRPLVGLEHLALASAISLFAWLSVFAALAIFMRFLNKGRPLIRYISSASYWVYLSHFPVVAVTQLIILPMDVPVALKFSVSVLTALAFGFLTYEFIVRNTLIGACINGRVSESRLMAYPFTLRARLGFTFVVLMVVITGGVSFQNYYHHEKIRYEKAITDYYREYLHREPDANGLRHWTAWALGRWGLEKVEEEGFLKAPERMEILKRMGGGISDRAR